MKGLFAVSLGACLTFWLVAFAGDDRAEIGGRISAQISLDRCHNCLRRPALSGIGFARPAKIRLHFRKS